MKADSIKILLCGAICILDSSCVWASILALPSACFPLLIPFVDPLTYTVYISLNKVGSCQYTDGRLATCSCQIAEPHPPHCFQHRLMSPVIERRGLSMRVAMLLSLSSNDDRLSLCSIYLDRWTCRPSGRTCTQRHPHSSCPCICNKRTLR